MTSDRKGLKTLLEIKPSERYRNWAFSNTIQSPPPLTAEDLDRAFKRAIKNVSNPQIGFVSLDEYKRRSRVV